MRVTPRWWIVGSLVMVLLGGGYAQEDRAREAATRPPPAARQEPGEGAPRHEPDENEVVAVLSGEGEVHVDGWKRFIHGWTSFGDWRTVAQIAIMAVITLILSSAIAYHPSRKQATLDEVEQPKIFLMYGLVGAVVGQICIVSKTMAFIIFGLGGLFRFRTDVGPARDTGRLILVTLVGVCCGLSLFLTAVLATALTWFLIFFLESRVAFRVTIKGLGEATLAGAASAYHEVLVENHCTVLSQKKNFLKKQVAFVFRAPKDFDRESLEELFKDIPPKLQGAPDWESS